MSVDEICTAKLSMLYELRLLLDSEEKETWSKDDIRQWIDRVARTKRGE